MEPTGELNTSADESALLRAKLESAQNEYDLLAGRMAHEMQAVLQAIGGFSQALAARSSAKFDETEQHYLERIHANAQKGNALVNDILGYYRIAVAPVATSTVRTDLLVQFARRQLPQVEVDWQIQANLPKLHGDPTLLQHAFSELLGVSAAGGARMATLTAQVKDGLAIFQLEDDGADRDAADLQRLLQPMWQRAEPGGQGSLAVLKRVVERHGGWIEAQPRAPHGTVVRFALPAEAATGGEIKGGCAHRGLRVLLVDDDPMVLVSVASMLERGGHAVTTATSGEQGLVAFEHAQHHVAVDLVITDWGMPGLGGGRVAAAIKRVSPATPVLVLTGRDPQEVRAELPQVDAVLAKPLRIGALRTLLQQLASGRGLAAPLVS